MSLASTKTAFYKQITEAGTFVVFDNTTGECAQIAAKDATQKADFIITACNNHENLLHNLKEVRGKLIDLRLFTQDAGLVLPNEMVNMISAFLLTSGKAIAMAEGN